MRAKRLAGALRRTPSRGGEIGWVQAYQKRNAEIQSRSYIGCFDCPDACDRLVYHRVVGVFIKAFTVNTRTMPDTPPAGLDNPLRKLRVILGDAEGGDISREVRRPKETASLP